MTSEELAEMKRLDPSYIDHVELINEIERLTNGEACEPEDVSFEFPLERGA